MPGEAIAFFIAGGVATLLAILLLPASRVGPVMTTIVTFLLLATLFIALIGFVVWMAIGF